MAFGELDSSPSLKNAINLSNAFSGIVLPSSGWQLEILNLPITSTAEDIENLFAKYGSIDKIGFIHKIKDKTVNCYVSYQNETDSNAALKENGKKVGVSLINVNKFVTPPDMSGTPKGNKRMRTEDSGGWGSTAETTSSGGWGEAPASNGWGSTESPARGGGGGRGGRGGGRGGGNSGRGCFKCGEEGHMSRECPKGGGGGGAGGRSCFKCGEEGHMSRECPKGGGNRCFKCQEEGHISRDCPKGGGRGCFNCGEEGHMSRECSKPRANRGRGRGGGGNFGDRSADTSSGGGWGAPAASTPVAAEGWD